MREGYSKYDLITYDLIKAILASNLAEDMKEALVNILISSRQPQPVYYNNNLTTTTDYAIRCSNRFYTGDVCNGI